MKIYSQIWFLVPNTCTQSDYRRYIPQLRGFTQWRNCLQGCLIPSEIWCIHSHCWWYDPLLQALDEMPFPSTTIQGFVCELVTQWPNVQSLHSCRCITPKHDRVTTFYTLWTTPSVTISKNPFAHGHGEMVRGGNF